MMNCVIFFCLQSLTYTLIVTKSKTLSPLLFTVLLIFFSITFTLPFQLISIILFAKIICIIFFYLQSLTYTLSITKIETLSTLLFTILCIIFNIIYTSPFKLIAIMLFAKIICISFFCVQSLTYTLNNTKIKTLSTLLFTFLIANMLFAMTICIIFFFLQ